MDRLRETFARCFGSQLTGENGKDIFVNDLFVVKYEGRDKDRDKDKDKDRDKDCDARGHSPSRNKKQSNLPPHYDQATFSFSLALNSGYEGGGTRFHSLPSTNSESSTILCDVGDAVIFRGDLEKHEGVEVLKGCRYVLVGFFYGKGKTDKEVKRTLFPQEEGIQEEENETKEDTGGGFKFDFGV